MQILCHHHEISSIIYNFSAYNTILVEVKWYRDNIDYRDNYSHDISWHEILVIAHPYQILLNNWGEPHHVRSTVKSVFLLACLLACL